MVAISHVLWTTGRILPLPEIADAAQAAGALLLVDGAQSAGQLDLHVEETGSDFYAISGQKWLLGPNGTGALWVHPRHHDRLRPALPSYLTYADGIVGNMRPGAARFDPGTLDLASLAGLAAAIAWVDGLEGGWQAWLALAGERVATARARLAAAGFPAVDPPGGSTGLVAFELPGHEPADVVAALAERSVLLRTIPETPYLRLSVGAWTSDARPGRPDRRPRRRPLRQLKHLYLVPMFHAGSAVVGRRCRPCGPGCTAAAVQRRGLTPMLQPRRCAPAADIGVRPLGQSSVGG